MCDNVSQLLSLLFLGSLSLIPNDTLRYSALGIAAGLALIYVLHLKRPSVQLNQLDDTINKTEEIIQNAKAFCSRDLLRLTAEGVRLLEIQRSASMIQCHILEAKTFTWKKYRLISRDIADCARGIKKIRTTVQLMVEAERQRKFTDDINATETLLTSVQCSQSPGDKSQSHLVGVTTRIFKPLKGIRKDPASGKQSMNLI
ncbi:hypothetical protein B0H13DRAFT_1913495 [Mycena leptocephala]|nr:hypothetical protein B0H13DRAFT_1913495 [Mycena leptocephala]